MKYSYLLLFLCMNISLFAQGKFYALVKGPDGQWLYINESGKFVNRSAGRHPHDFKKGILRKVKFGKVGYLDCRFNQVIKPVFSDGDDFKDGFARVRTNLWGFINTKGDTVVPFIYDECRNFSEGKAAVRNGNFWGFIDTTGKLIIPMKYRKAESFHNGLARVRFDYVEMYIDPKNSVVYEVPQKYAFTGNFSDGRAKICIRINGLKKWGFIDKNGKEIIQPTFDEAGNFSDGLAKVRLGYEWGFIDTSGQIRIKMKYEKTGDFTNGYVRVKKIWKMGSN